MSNKHSTNMLSDKISELLTSVPKSFDPEDDIHEETSAKVVDHVEDEEFESEISTSKFRRQNVDLLEDLDVRYKGKKTSRKDLVDSDELDSEHEDSVNSEDQSFDEDNSNDSQSDDDEEYDEEGEDYEENEMNETSSFKHLSGGDDSKAEKGQCVRNQLNMWESLLEMRIQLQKSLIISNKMPQIQTHNELSKHHPEFKLKVKETAKLLSHTLEKFLTLHSLLHKQYPETKSLNKNKKKDEESDEEIPSDTEDENFSSDNDEEETPKKKRKIEDFEQEISERHERYTKYRNSVIQKWHDKTKLMAGKKNSQHSVIDQINYVLNDKQRLIKRTKIKRSEYEIVGKQKEPEKESDIEKNEEDKRIDEEYDEEIFDDDDFYHQLLRELIEVKSADLTDPVQLGRQWIELQNLRSKMKRKIDTRATKGRKIRYTVHNKLVNFMAPIEENSTWTNEAKTELFSSLFGKNQIQAEN